MVAASRSLITLLKTAYPPFCLSCTNEATEGGGGGFSHPLAPFAAAAADPPGSDAWSPTSAVAGRLGPAAPAVAAGVFFLFFSFRLAWQNGHLLVSIHPWNRWPS